MSTIGPYQLNTIYSGDCRELSKAIPNESVDLVLTDPPFGIGFKYANGYQDDPEQYYWLLMWIILESNRIVKPGGMVFVFQAINRLREFMPMFPSGSRIFSAAKNFVQIHSIPVEYAFDPVVFWQKPGKYGKAASGRDWHVGNTANTQNRGMADAGWHSCPRPLDTITYMVDNFCPDGGLVCDFFMGSGTTAVAAKITGRQFIGFELDPDTAEKANSRVIKTHPPIFGAAANNPMQATFLRSASESA